jgi:helicase required for RNAi-mediated heterochromatin assembly 1
MKSSDKRPIKSMDINRLFKERDNIEKEMTCLCEEIGNPFIELDFIKEQGYLTDEQISSLKQDDWFMSSSSDNNDDSERNYIQEWLEPSLATTTSRQNDVDFLVSQLISEDSGIQMDEDEEVDEEDIENALADYRGSGNQITSKDKFVKLRSDKCIRSDTFVSDDTMDEHCSAEDLWDIPQEVRVAIHNRWRRKRLEEVCEELKKLCKKYSELSDKIKNERIREDLVILKSARIIGMTTTAAVSSYI